MYQILKLKKFPKLVHGFSTKDERNMSTLFGGITADKNVIFKNQKKFLEKLNIEPDKCIRLWLQNSDNLIVAGSSSKEIDLLGSDHTPKADSIITDQKDIFLFMVVADCAPIVLYDTVKETVGLIHAGWKGADLGLVKKVIKRLSDLYGTKPSDLVVGIGPSARKDSYIKSDPKQLDDPKWKGFLEPVSEDKYKVDFIGLIKKQLNEAGVKRKNVNDCGIDTAKDSRFFSHYRESGLAEANQGRFACVVGMK